MTTSTRTLSIFPGRRLQPCTLWDSWTLEEKQGSYDRHISRTISGRLAYDVAGKVQEHWDTVLCPVISEYLHTHSRKILKGYAYAWNGRVDCWMMAPQDPATLLPFVVITHPDDGVGRRFMSLLKKEPRIAASGFTIIRRRGNLTWVTGSQSETGASQNPPWKIAQVDEPQHTASKRVTHDVVSKNDSQTFTPGITANTKKFEGAVVWGRHLSTSESSGRFRTTIGGIVEVGGVPHALLAAHPFLLGTHDYPTPQQFTDSEVVGDWFFDEETTSDDDSVALPERSEGSVIETEYDSPSLLALDQSVDNHALIFDCQLRLFNANYPDDLSFVEQSGRNVGYYGPDFDWVLFQIRRKMMNIIKLGDETFPIRGIPTTPTLGKRLPVLRYRPLLADRTFATVCTGSAIIHPPGSPKPVSVMVLNRNCSKGDSGAWVVDAVTGILYGMVVATDPQLNTTYAVRAQDLFRDMNKVTGKSVTLPTSPQVHQPPKQPASERSHSTLKKESFPSFQDFIKHRNPSHGVSPIDAYATSGLQQDPWLAGDHIGKRFQERLNLFSDLDDMWLKAVENDGKGKTMKGKEKQEKSSKSK